MPRRINECISRAGKEEVVSEDCLSINELLLGFLKIKVDIERFHEIGEGIRVLVALLPHNSNKIFDLLLICTGIFAPISIGDYSGCEVSQDPGAVRLNGVDEGWREEHFGKALPSGLIVEEREEAPVDKPSAMLKLRQRVVEESSIDGITNLLDLLHGTLPFGRYY